MADKFERPRDLTASFRQQVQPLIRGIVQPRSQGPFHRGLGNLVHPSIHLDVHASRRPISTDRARLDNV